MEAVDMEMDTSQQNSSDPLLFARSYQVEALEKAINQNTIAYLETGSGKTLIAIMLLRYYACLIRKPSSFFAVFLVPQVVLVKQQADALEMHTDLKVGKYWGDMEVDFWDGAKWNQEFETYEVLVMTPQLLLNGLRHGYFKMNMIKVLIMDECHHAKGMHPYASIMREFYHRHSESGVSNLPRIFGMTASPINTKGERSADGYWRKIHELETIMNSKVYTCTSESVLAQFVPFSTPKFKFYKHMKIPNDMYTHLEKELDDLKVKHECSLDSLDLEASAVTSATKKISKIHSVLIYCLNELGVWLAFKAAEYLSCSENEFLPWERLEVCAEKIIRKFSSDAFRAIKPCLPSGPDWTIGDDIKGSVDAGFLTTKVLCLTESLFEYRALKDIRCIIFVQRVLTTIVLQSLLSELLPKYSSWKAKYIAGTSSGLLNQTRTKQNDIVEEFRKGMINIIVATSILEEGLDVQSCNLIIRFDPSSNICSFIQSRGRARMQNSDYLLMVESGDSRTLSRLQEYLACGEVMRKESLSHASDPCSPLTNDSYDEEFYRVESTGARMTPSSSVGLIRYYCSRLPGDMYFKPSPRCVEDKEMGICTIHLPKSCPIQIGSVKGNNSKNLKKKACFEACKQLHQIGALTDHLVPDVVEEKDVEETGKEPYNDDQPIFYPPELVTQGSQEPLAKYYCYLMELNQNFDCEFPVHNVVLLLRNQLEMDERSVEFEMEVDRGALTVNLKHIGSISLYSDQIIVCRRFQIAVFRVLMDRKAEKLTEMLCDLTSGNSDIDFLLLPSNYVDQKPAIDWFAVSSVLFSYENVWNRHKNCNAGLIQTKSGMLCACMIENSLVSTPHNGHVYIINGFRNNLNANSVLKMSDGSEMTYKEYYRQRHGIRLRFDQVSFLSARDIFPVRNHLQRCRKQKEKESSNAFVELPPELCDVLMSPISISTFYSFAFVPSIMHRIESLLLATSLGRMIHPVHCVQNVAIPTMKVLEAITTKKCQESFHLESLETLGDSFLKYAVCRKLFQTHQNHHEGLLSIKKDRIVSNAALCFLGCNKKLPGFIRYEPFDPKSWMIPGCRSGIYTSFNEETLCNSRKMYVSGRRKVRSKKIADVVEALIGAYLSTGGEAAALSFMKWLGITTEVPDIQDERRFEVQAQNFVNVRYLESLLKYSFKDSSVLVESLTHGSYMLPAIPGCYQRLEFLGDSVLDYLITLYFYNKYPGIVPGLLTDLRSASVNNNCYALSAVKAGLHKHILHASQKLHKDMKETVQSFHESSLEHTFGWESEKSFPKVLGDVMESLAGAILVDSGYDKDIVFRCIRPLLEPMITPETMTVHPVKELYDLCQKEHYELRKRVVSRDDGVSSITIEVEANGRVFKHTSTASNKKMAKKLASKEVLKSVKAANFS
ncbi:endoribonuclease Dicer homolog 2-like [Hibiscus syriacus]|uniref:endoribonuclease Dicer homolog 2-like n=1 Tax=Hibiscus syriacus TaxID=106335 RepID=UPI0019220F42|nr:endoribonuclease Dicer homolog 2-like [Hibiscus syriacus]